MHFVHRDYRYFHQTFDFFAIVREMRQGIDVVGLVLGEGIDVDGSLAVFIEEGAAFLAQHETEVSVTEQI